MKVPCKFCGKETEPREWQGRELELCASCYKTWKRLSESSD